MSRERPTKKTLRRFSIAEERRRKLEFRNRKLKELEAIKTQAVAEAVAKLVRTEIKEEVRLQMIALGVGQNLPTSGGPCSTTKDTAPSAIPRKEET